MTDAEKQRIVAIEAAWNSDKTKKEIKFEFGLSHIALQKLAVQNGWRKKRPAAAQKDDAALCPPPEELAQRAAEVRARWTETEKERRWCGPKTQMWVPRQYVINPKTKKKKT